MQSNNFKLIDKGYNSQIFLYDNNIILKMVDVKFTKQIRHVGNQFNLMKHQNHPNILKVLGLKHNIPIKGTSNPTSDCRRDVLMMQYANAGSLLSVIKLGLDTQDKKCILLQMIEAFTYLHQFSQVAHRDIKLDNILVRKEADGNMIALISDFGFAVQNPEKNIENSKQGKKDQGNTLNELPRQNDLKSQKTTTNTSKPFLVNSYKGTKRAYMAPQLHKLVSDVNNASNPKAYDPFKVDVFSFGVVLFSLFFQKLPFELSSQKDPIYGYISQGKWEQFWVKHKLDEQKYSDINLEELKTLLERMLQEHPEKRIGMKDVNNSAFVHEIRVQLKLQKQTKQLDNKTSKQ